MSTTKILLAEDDKNLGMVLKTYLEAKDYPTTLCINGKEALQAYQKDVYDFCIFDVMMPVMDGFTLAQKIRAKDSTVPILFLTAKSLEEDKIKGFQSGADDYLTKPFSMEELLVRIQAILRRSNAFENESAFDLGKYHFDTKKQVLTVEEKEKKLTSKESELLKLLCQNKNQVLSRTKALKKIWGDDNYFNARSMDVYITKLRKYLKEDSNIELINVHGIGFKLVLSS